MSSIREFAEADRSPRGNRDYAITTTQAVPVRSNEGGVTTIRASRSYGAGSPVRASGAHHVAYEEGGSYQGSLNASYGAPKIVDNSGTTHLGATARSSGNFTTTRLGDTSRAGNTTMSATGRPGYNERGQFMETNLPMADLKRRNLSESGVRVMERPNILYKNVEEIDYLDTQYAPEEVTREVRYKKEGERAGIIQEVTKEVIIEKPVIQIQYQDRIVTERVEVPIIEFKERIVEKIVEVNVPTFHETIRERVVEVPVIEYRDRIVEKIVETPRTEYVDRYVDKIVEVPVVEYREVIVKEIIEVPKLEYVEVIKEKIVEVQRIEYRDRYHDKIVEVMVPEYREVEKQKVVIEEKIVYNDRTVVNTVEKPMINTVEKINEIRIEVPRIEYQDRI